MWYLSSEYDNRIMYVVPQKSEVIIGRSADEKICNFAISDDPSISRRHAILLLKENALFVKDSGSRYGTFINNATETLPADSDTRLNNGDIVKFGKMNSVWKVHMKNLTTCTSTLPKSDLQTVMTILSQIGGVYNPEWEESCKFLTMPVITLTIKVVLALVQGCHIVTTEYWHKCLESVNNNADLPDPCNFTPSVAETTLNKEIVSFLPNAQRKTIFAGKKIVFFIKTQYEMYYNVLINSGAEPILFSDVNLSSSSLCDQSIIVIQDNKAYTSVDHKNQVMKAITCLRSNNKRPVPESDIGLAILYCSTEKYCNPDFNLSSEIIKPTHISKQGNVLALESQEGHNTACKENDIVINETLTPVKNEVENAGKRKYTDDFDEIQRNANKKLATGTSLVVADNVSKRKFSEDGSDSNPSKKLAIQNNSENEDLFNFITSDNTTNNKADVNKNESTKKLNLAKPTKRKAEVEDDDNLFNFVNMDKPDNDHDASNKEDVKISKTNATHAKKTGNITLEEITAMRGIKLAELMKSSKESDKNPMQINIKKEIKDELDEKMSGLDLGTTIVTVRNDLIVKKEPIEIEEPSSTVRNFKKFKKVWPLKMNVTTLPKISMSMTTVGGN